MRQLNKFTSVLLGGTTFLYCLHTQFQCPNYCQAAPTTSSTVERTKEKEAKKVATKAKVGVKVQIKDPPTEKSKSTISSQRPEWWPSSDHAAVLVATGKIVEGEKILALLVPQARQDIPNSLDLGVTLARYGIALLANKKYDEAVTTLSEATRIIHEKPSNERQETAMFQALGAEGAALLQLHKYDKAEPIIRKSIAYAIAFPNILHHANLKKCYVLLRLSLEGQNKPDEAAVIADILTGF